MKKFVATVTLSVTGLFKGFLRYPCNYVFGKTMQVSAVKMYSRYVECFFAPYLGRVIETSVF